MKKLSLIPVLFSFLSHAQVPDIDTIYVNQSGVTLIFPKEVAFALPGIKADYLVENTGSVVKVNAKKENTRVTSLAVQYGESEEIFTTVLKYKDVVNKMVYNFKKTAKVVSPEEEKLKRELLAMNDSKLRVKKTLDELLDFKDEIQTVGTKMGNIIFTLSTIRIDDEYTYLMLLLDNETNVDFKIDYIRFQALDKLKSDESLTDNRDTDLKPFVATSIDVVKKNSKEYLLYAIPVYGTSQKGGYKVTLKELTGNRKPVMIIKSKILETAKFIKH